MSKTAIITGAFGANALHLTKYLLDLNYKVVGIKRRVAARNQDFVRLFDNYDNYTVVEGDITDISSLIPIIETFEPQEFYHAAAQSHVHKSFKYPILTAETTGIGVLNCLESLCLSNRIHCKFLQFSSSEMFGNTITKERFNGERYVALNESSPLEAASPYAAAKIYAHNIVKVYRDAYGMFASTTINFNNEGPFRGEDFVTRKITSSLARIKHGLQDKLYLGNPDARRDWTFTGDTVRAAYLILQHHEPDDFVISSGESHSVREFVDLALEYFNLSQDVVVYNDDRFTRPKDVDVLLGDSSKARRLLEWQPEVTFEELVEMMCRYDMAAQSPSIVDKEFAAKKLVFAI